MEVHHPHGHSKSRNWKSYVGEFLMLFLAVFSGFVAENMRENYVEKERAHQYINSMVADLKKDTLQLQTNYCNNLGQQKRQGDTTIVLLRKNYHLN